MIVLLNVVTGECEAPSHNLASTKPSKALKAKQGSNASFLHLQLLHVLPCILQVINFLPKCLLPAGNTVKSRNTLGLSDKWQTGNAYFWYIDYVPKQKYQFETSLEVGLSI